MSITGAKEIYIKVSDAVGNVSGALRISIPAYNHAPSFAGAGTELTVDENSTANSLKALLHASDPDGGQTLTWTQVVAPAHGALTFAGATAASGGADIAPNGTIAYTPVAGYYGRDSFIIQVSDGERTDTRVIDVTVTPVPEKLPAPAGLAWDATTPGMARWSAVAGASSYTVQLYQNGVGLGVLANIPPSTLSYNFTSAIAAAGDGVYTFRVTAKGDGIDYDDSNPSALSGGYAYAAPETADASNNGVTADNTDITLGGAVTLTAFGDRQNEPGTVSGEERYLPVSWISSEAGKSGSFGKSGGMYTSAYAPSVSGIYTVTATFQKQVYNGASWSNVSGGTDAKTVVIRVSQASYVVRFEDWDGTLLKEQNVESGNGAAAPKDPQRTGYTFTGWNSGFDEITKDTTVTAEYEISSYTVSFSSNIGGSVASQRVEYGSSARKPGDPAREGYAFAGWYADSALNRPYDFSSAVVGNITLYAKWMQTAEVPEVAEAAEVTETQMPEPAIRLAAGDTWECVTSDFVMSCDAGDDGAQILWTSSNTGAVRIEQNGSGATGVVTRPQGSDASVVITAKVTKDGKTVIKTFLLIIAREDASKNETRSVTERTASVQAGENADGETETIYRTTMDDGTNIDYVTVTADTVQRLVESGATAENVVVRIDRNADSPADEFAFEVSPDTVSALVQNGMGVMLESPAGSATLSLETLKQAEQSGTALYFRIVPVEDEAGEAEQAFRSDGAVFSLSNSVTGQVFGTPKTIQTNMEGYATTITLPLEGLSDEQLSDGEFLKRLCVYAEHDDGTAELVYGTLVYTDGVPTGIRFEISQFSRFQVVSVQKVAATSPWIWIVFLGGVLAALGILLLAAARRKKRKQADARP